MTTLKQEIIRLKTAKVEIKDALVSKGINIEDNEWYLKGIIEKEPVEHKYIGEMPGGDIVDDIVDEQYISQIVAKIL